MKTLIIAGLAIIALQSCSKEKLPTPIGMPDSQKTAVQRKPHPTIIRCGTPVPGTIKTPHQNNNEAVPFMSYPPLHQDGTPIYIPGKSEVK